MIRNYIITALRNIVRFKLHSVINIGGLALGISIFTLIMIYVVSELSYDKYHENYDKIYQVSIFDELVTTAHLGYTMKEKFPEIRHLVRIDQQFGGGKNAYLKQLNSDKLVDFKDIIYAEPDFFNMFSVRPVAGDLSTALNNPYALVLTESSAMKLFGSTDVVSKSIDFISGEGRIRHIFTITAVIADVPDNSSIKYTAIASFSTLNDIKPGGLEVDQDHYNWGYLTFITLHDNIEVIDFVKKARAEFVNFICGKNDIDPESDEVNEITMEMVPLGKAPFYGNNKIQFISLIILLGILILVIALINFINLSLAKSTLRSREIGLRKVAGSSRINLISQFIGEAIVLASFAVFASIILTEIIKPLFNKLIEKELSIGYLEEPYILLIFFAGTIVIGVLAGFYPAIVLSRFNPIKTLKNEVASGKKGMLFKQSLSIIQITISLVLIIGVIIISKQINFMKTKDLGFDNTNIIYFQSNDDINEKYILFKQRILEHPAIYSVARAGSEFGQRYHITDEEEFNGVKISYQAMVADPDFVETMGLEIVEGRNYIWDRASDIGAMLINETAAKEFEVDSIIGYRMSMLGSQQHIVGIYKDVNNESFHKKISPCALVNYNVMLHSINIKLNGHNKKAAIDHVEKVWNETIPDVPFQYNFLDDKYDQLYEKEAKFGLVIKLSSLFSILIACLGLFGMVSYTSERRKKEIGIRKSTGASAADIMMLLQIGIVKWLGIATILACPVAYYATDKWLQNFAYRTPINIGVFVLAVFIVSAISLLAVSFVVLKAAKTNPAECLRSE
ncbi:MAG: ABC transporter permease [Bacteroidales bacterium]|nr:ABC transporter permease [Bacteroidales bacterium]